MRSPIPLVRFVAAALWLASLPLSPSASADEPATAKGTWSVDGREVDLKHVRAFREPEPFGKGTSPCVLLSNQPVPDEAIPDDDEGVATLLDLMRSGPTRALQICFDAGGSKLRNVNDAFAFHPDVSPGKFGFQGFHQWAPKPESGRIAGRLTGAGDTNAGGRWTDEVELSVPLAAESTRANP
jgi:hypothetical protein